MQGARGQVEVARAPREGSLRRFFAVAVELAETAPATMRPGMSAKVNVLARAAPELPASLRARRWRLDGDHATARLYDGGERAVALQFCTAQRCAVANGLREGDRLRVAEDPS